MRGRESRSRGKCVLGIDLGTSSVKILQRYQDGSVRKASSTYATICPDAWWDAICKALSDLELKQVVAIGLSSQVGTYIVNEKDVIGWHCNAGNEELRRIKEKYKTSEFVKEISMSHPDILSYPMPRLVYIKKKYPEMEWVCQPKELIMKQLTGRAVTDPYSWRGLANLKEWKYSEYFLQEMEINAENLPDMIGYQDLAGYTRKILIGDQFLPGGIPVFTGLNDYFAALLGMGVQSIGDMFDITGTSEHFGLIEDKLNVDTPLVSGPYLSGYVHYGVTASSGCSLYFGNEIYDLNKVNIERVMSRKPPIFLPYLNGERAPIWDGDARGMFFGIEQGCTKEDMAYAVMEGVVFSLYHIYEKLGIPDIKKIKISGGATRFSELNKLKAEMFKAPVAVMKERDSSALGAALIAAVGVGWYQDLKSAIEEVCTVQENVIPTGIYWECLRKRYQIYKALYPAVKVQYKKWREITR